MLGGDVLELEHQQKLEASFSVSSVGVLRTSSVLTLDPKVSNLPPQSDRLEILVHGQALGSI